MHVEIAVLKFIGRCLENKNKILPNVHRIFRYDNGNFLPVPKQYKPRLAQKIGADHSSCPRLPKSGH